MGEGEIVAFRKYEQQLIERYLSLGTLFPHIHLHGVRGCGKKLVLNTVLHKMEIQYTTVACFQWDIAPRNVFETIINAVKHDLNQENGQMPEYNKCESPLDLFNQLRELLMHVNEYAIVFDRAEKLRESPPSVLNAVLKLPHMLKKTCNLTVITVGYLPWSKFFVHPGIVTIPHSIDFPTYYISEMIEIVRADNKHDTLWFSYCKHLLDLVAIYCVDLVELKLLASVWYSTYRKPVDKGEFKATEGPKLFNRFSKYIKKAVKGGYLMEGPPNNNSNIENEPVVEEDSVKKVVCPELPKLSKFVVICAYLASYNPPITDKRYFLKYSKNHKAWSLACATEAKSAHILGPKAFPLERLMLIFACISDENTKKQLQDINVSRMISSLTSKGMLTRMSAPINLDSPKFRCNVQWDLIQAIARTLNFEIHRYLYDFRS